MFKMTHPEIRMCHYVNGLRFVADRARYATMNEYKIAVREAYGSLHGVTFDYCTIETF